MHKLIRKIVESRYDIGRVAEVREIYGGFNNRSFRVVTHTSDSRSLYLVRRYRETTTLSEIRFEHRLVGYARAHGMEIIADILKTTKGDTFVETEGAVIWCVCGYLPGEDRYSWTETQLRDREFAHAAKVLADYHNAVCGFDPGAFKRAEPPIKALLPLLPGEMERVAKGNRADPFYRCCGGSIGEMLAVIRRRSPGPDLLEGLPEVAAHYDFHPGNLKWKDREVVGLFDFDWAKMDLRLFDLCMALVYCCTHWGGESDGAFRPEKAAIFLKRYQERMRLIKGLEPVSEEESAFFADMLAIANLYLIRWEMTDYARIGAVRTEEYLVYLEHSVRLMHWIEQCHTELVGWAKEALN